MSNLIGLEVGVILNGSRKPLYGSIKELNEKGFVIRLENSDDTVFVPADDISVMQL